MNNFTRALLQASRYWPSLVLATLCSFAVAGLWGANIGAFYPILEVTIKGQSTQEWLQTEIDSAGSEVRDITALIVEESARFQKANDDESRLRLSRSIDDLQNSKAAVSSRLISYEKMQPWVEKFVPQSPFATISLIVAALIFSTLLRHVFLISNEMLVGRVALSISRGFRNRVFNQALLMDKASFRERGNANFVTLIIHTTDMLSAGLMSAFGAAIREPLKLIACLAGAAYICWKLLVLSIVVAPICGLLLYVVTRKLKTVSQRVLERATGFHEVLLESLENINTVQTFRQESYEQGRFEDATHLMKSFGLRFLFLTSLSKPIIEFLGVGMLGTTIIGGAYLVLNNETHLWGIQICPEPLSVSALLVFFGMLIGVSDPLRKLSAVYGSIYAGTVAADTLFPVLDQTTKIGDPDEPVEVARPHGKVTFRNLGFGYISEQRILDDVSMEIGFGSTVAVVGSNGSGKSTLIHLLCRFYDPSSGSIDMDGIPLSSLRLDDLRSRIALVNQQTELFDESVAYNIRYGRPDATDEEVRDAARKAHADHFIMHSLEDGYDSTVGRNGCKLSGGQRQRIALARALICNPEILILDEATSQIDMQSEQAIRESLETLRGQCTMIIITHREKLLEIADRVFEMRDGKLVPQGDLEARAA
ncbi:MAG: ABC transporter ATP-binding protein [Aureliella sp.]